MFLWIVLVAMKKIIHKAVFLFPLAIIGFGLISFIFGQLPAAFMPAQAARPLHSIVVTYACAVFFIITGMGIIAGIFSAACARLIAVFFFINLIYPQLTLSLQQFSNAGLWTVTLEILALCSGASMLTRIPAISKLAKYTFALSFLGFALLHYMYADYIVTLIPAWMPAHYLLNALVFAGFVGIAASLIFNMYVNLAGICFGSMFCFWVITLHLPRCLSSMSKEAEWSSLCIAVAMAGIGFLLAAEDKNQLPAIAVKTV